ncbi:MAG: gliding motility-associated C-terminal domain-containing protein [Bacteroidetes bacterium]|nr:gliding motility-associated C-terminal domain-containing protein [Bacteroidota bacterium]
MFLKQNNKFLIGLLILISSPFSLFSSHHAGGKITYRYLGSNKYELKLTVYRDCGLGINTVPFDNPALISIFDKSTTLLIANFGMALKSVSVVPANPMNPCFVPPMGICLDVGTYIDTIQLNPNTAGYTISYQRCCRNLGITNIISATSDIITLTTDVPPQINNTPNFINTPPIFVCVNDTFKYSFASTDADGDLLKYNLCSPLIGSPGTNLTLNPASPPPYLPVNWSSTFTATNPIPNSGGISLNQNTGQLKFKPSMLGQFAIGVCVEEYRNNQLINTNRLELQFNIVNCYLTSSIPTASNLCEGLTIPFQNGSTNANAFHWNFGDLTTVADTSNLQTPTYTYPSYGTYTVSLTVFNTAYGFCKDSTKKIINVHPLLQPTLQTTYSSCFKNNNFNFNVGGSFDPSANFNWHFTQSSNSPNTNTNPTTAHFTTDTTKHISVIINQFGCIDTLKATVSFTNPVPMINKSELDCNEKNLTFNNSSYNSTNYFWNFGDPTTTLDTSTISSPTYSYTNYGNYPITLIAYNGICSDTLKDTIHVFPKLQLNWINTIQQQCQKNNSFNFTPTGIWGNNPTFFWWFYDSPSVTTSTLQNPTNIHFTSLGNHLIRYIVKENGCTKIAQAVVIINPNPTANPIISDTIGCAPLTIKLKQKPPPTHPLQVLWSVSSNTFTTDSVIYTFNNSGLYSYNIVVTDSNNCTDTVSKINYIKVNPKPKAIAIVSPLQTNILNSQITFIDSTLTNHTTYFNYGNGATSTQTLNNYFYPNAGQYQYSLITTNTFGCADTINGTIIIDDIGQNNIPNIFTPNNDGANDNFFIKGQSISTSSMLIFNRWGTQIFQTNNALIGWNGINQTNNSVADDGVYFYIIQLNLNNTKTYTFKGNVTLLK